MQRSVGIIPIVCLHIQCSSNHRHDVSSFRYTFAVILSTASWWWCRYSCFGARAGSGGRADEVEDVDLELGVALGFGGGFVHLSSVGDLRLMTCELRIPDGSR